MTSRDLNGFEEHNAHSRRKVSIGVMKRFILGNKCVIDGSVFRTWSLVHTKHICRVTSDVLSSATYS